MGELSNSTSVRPALTRVLVGAGVGPTRPPNGVYVHLKTSVEWVGALFLLVIAAPLLVGLAALLKGTSKGPVFYSQLRLGRLGRAFWIYKLRTMTDGCETATGPVWSIADDPRVTKVGQWLRDTHLDELPQLWNVLRGDMSLIGPRPERPELASKIEHWLPEFRERLRVRPGITGLAQVRMPADSDLHTVRQKLAHDLQYIRRLGPLLDARIALSTVLHLVGQVAWRGSHRLVEPFAPRQPIEAPHELPKLDLTLTGRSAGRLHIVTEEDDLPQAA